MQTGRNRQILSEKYNVSSCSLRRLHHSGHIQMRVNLPLQMTKSKKTISNSFIKIETHFIDIYACSRLSVGPKWFWLNFNFLEWWKHYISLRNFAFGPMFKNIGLVRNRFWPTEGLGIVRTKDNFFWQFQTKTVIVQSVNSSNSFIWCFSGSIVTWIENLSLSMHQKISFLFKNTPNWVFFILRIF